jgi:(p)ppGpp synthase/HD superfamily hydrolase
MELKLLEKAAFMAFDYHKNQTRKFKDEPQVNHCLRVGSLLGDYTDDPDIVAAGITHDILEDTYAVVVDLEETLNHRVANLVWELTDNKRLKSSMDYNLYTLDKFNSLSNDAFTIKLVDRLDNLTDLVNLPQAPISFVKKYVYAIDYTIDNLQRELVPVHESLLDTLTFINNYIALTRLR